MINKLNWIAANYEMTGDQLFFIVSQVWEEGTPELSFKKEVHARLFNPSEK